MWRNDPRDEKNSAFECSFQQVVVYGYGRQNFNLKYQILNVFQLAMVEFLNRLHFLKKTFIIMTVLHRPKRLMTFVLLATNLPLFIFLKPEKHFYRIKHSRAGYVR